MSLRTITKVEEIIPPHRLSVKVTFDCGHSYVAHGLFAKIYRSNKSAECEYCRTGR